MILFRWHSLKTLPTAICDVGAGAGFPSIPLKIVFPSLNVTIVDSLNKRITFLTELVNQLGWLVSLYHDRAETFGQKQNFVARLITLQREQCTIKCFK